MGSSQSSVFQSQSLYNLREEEEESDTTSDSEDDDGMSEKRKDADTPRNGDEESKKIRMDSGGRDDGGSGDKKEEGGKKSPEVITLDSGSESGEDEQMVFRTPRGSPDLVVLDSDTEDDEGGGGDKRSKSPEVVKVGGSPKQSQSSDDFSYEEDDEDFEVIAPSAEARREKISKVEVLNTEDEVRGEMKKMVEEVEEKLRLGYSLVAALLDHFSWDTQMLYDKYYSEDKDEYFGRHGFALPTTTQEDKRNFNSAKLPSDGNEKECEICYMPFTPKESHVPSCGHVFCPDCSFQYIVERVAQGSLPIGCPSPECKFIWLEDYTRSLIQSDESLVSKFDRLLLNEFIGKIKVFKYCPHTNCNKIWKLNGTICRTDGHELECQCGEAFCFECTDYWHFPLNCSLTRNWTKRVSNDSANATWIRANTKPCPNCSYSIEKNGGCNHMHCRKCRHEFCWICLAQWSAHRDAYNCNRIRQDVDLAQSSARQYFLRFAKAHDRFRNHGDSYILEKRLLESADDRMEEIHQACNMSSWSEAFFYKEAVKVLLACRRLLQYSFAFVFFLEDGLSEVEIFENNMINLHESIETLSGYLENKITAAELGQKKDVVLNLTNYCRERRKVLIKHVEEGTEKDKWVYKKDLMEN